MSMRLPARILEHPVESVLAVALLLVLLFGSADRQAIEHGTSRNGTGFAVTGKV